MALSPQGGFDSKSLKQITPNHQATFKVVGYSSKQNTPMMTTASNRFGKEVYGAAEQTLRGAKKSGTRQSAKGGSITVQNSPKRLGGTHRLPDIGLSVHNSLNTTGSF